MSYFNNHEIGKKNVNQLTSNPFVEEFKDALFNPPPPGGTFMITEDLGLFMMSESTTDLMITER